MVEHAGDYEWRGEGEGAEVVIYAPGEELAEAAFGRVAPITRLSGVESPIHAAASPESFGWVAASASHAAPDLISIPERGLLLAADVPAEDLGMPPRGIEDLVLRALGEVGYRLPPLSEAGVRRACEEGARAAAEDGLIDEEDLSFLAPAAGDPDAVGRRAIAAGPSDPEDRIGLRAAVIAEVLDAEGAESLGLERGMLALVVMAGAGDLGRLALSAHRERIFGRIRAGTDFGAQDDLPAAPAETEEAADLVAAVAAASNFADGQAARAIYALRRVLRDVAGGLRVRAAWRVGGIETFGSALVHRRDLAAVGEGEVLVSGGSVTAGTGKMSRSAPPFGAPGGSDGEHPWEEAGVLERWADLDPTEGGA
jgi:tRNA-splicing ligase RtcB (3'-phosphate/5'-hydroxy nucleic acid ligase)